jgi:hypothetical protein
MLKTDISAGGGGEVAQTMHTHVSKCKNDKIKGQKKTDISISNVLVYFLPIVRQ